MPVVIQEKVQPGHGELFGKIENHEVRYDPADYEPLREPIVLDTTDSFVKTWNLGGLGLSFPAIGCHVSGVRTWVDGDPLLQAIRDLAPEESREGGVSILEPIAYPPIEQERSETNPEAPEAATGTQEPAEAPQPAQTAKPVLDFPKPPRRDRGHK
jgi:hypothetical protein